MHKEVQTSAANLASCRKSGAQCRPVQVVQQGVLVVRQCWNPQARYCHLPARVSRP